MALGEKHVQVIIPAEIRSPEGGVVVGAIRLWYRVMLEIGKLTNHGPECSFAFAFQFDKLATGHFVYLSVGFAMKLGLDSLLFQSQLLGGERIGPIVLPGNKRWIIRGPSLCPIGCTSS